jgi:hypothetical protein
VKFNGDDNKTTWEHVSQYLAQLGASAIEEIKGVKYVGGP